MSGNSNDQQRASASHAKILIVDDEEAVINSAGYFLRTKGYHVVGARAGDEALDLLEGENFDIVITDVFHPGADVYVIIETATTFSDAKVIVMSGTVPELVNPLDLKNAGATAIRKKPIKLIGLDKTIQRILTRDSRCAQSTQSQIKNKGASESKPRHSARVTGTEAQPGSREVVYGTYDDIETIFLPVETARHYVKLHTYHRQGVTFERLFYEFPDVFQMIIRYFCGQYYDIELPWSTVSSCDEYYIRLLKLLYEELVDGGEWIGPVDVYRKINSFIEFTDFYRNGLSPGERLPLSSDLFSRESFDHNTLLEIINYEPRIDWVPKEILKELGHFGGSPMHGEATCFFTENEEKIIEAFEDIGFICFRNDKLIANSYGLWPKR